MLFSRQLPLSHLITLCHVLRHNLGAGLTLRRVFGQQAERGPAAVRPMAGRVHKELDRGSSLEDALDRERQVLPPLFLTMASVGEATGHLPEIFGELETYFRFQQQLRRQIQARIIGPVLQFLLAVLVIAGLFMVLGWISAARGTEPPRFLGVPGAAGGWLFLFLIFGGIALGYVAYAVAARRFLHRPEVEALLLGCPRIGPCLQALALGRFALALQLTLDSGLSIGQALRLSLAATGNGVFTRQTAIVERSLKSGNDLTTALTEAAVFPRDFRNMVAVGEESGRVPEVMRHQAQHYYEEAQRRLTALTRTFTGAVWLAYALFMGMVIFRIFGIYRGALGG